MLNWCWTCYKGSRSRNSEHPNEAKSMFPHPSYLYTVHQDRRSAPSIICTSHKTSCHPFTPWAFSHLSSGVSGKPGRASASTWTPSAKPNPQKPGSRERSMSRVLTIRLKIWSISSGGFNCATKKSALHPKAVRMSAWYQHSQGGQGKYTLFIWGGPPSTTLTEFKHDHRINAQMSGPTELFSS